MTDKPKPAPPFRPLAVSIPDAAALLDFSETYFRKNILSQLPVLWSSRPRILVKDLEVWLDAKVTPVQEPIDRRRYFVAQPPQPLSHFAERVQRAQRAAARRAAQAAKEGK